ncbi:MAG: methylenetetrahydrofolate reductase [Candidatus Aminicenantes bacterium]|nr:MAG: methylenetetrahydrofolate reductase [Candidatus Aminicenantes bacterium]
MSIKDLWKERKRPSISFEFFPARDEKAAQKLDKVMDNLAVLEPDFVSVTFGAGGSTREGSYQLAEKLKNDKNLEVLPYVAAYGLGPDELTSVLDSYKQLGIENIFCVRGDQPEIENFQPHPDSLPHASDFLSWVGERYDFFKGAAAYPEGHKEAETMEKDLEYLKLKVEKDAGFIITQYCYDNGFFFNFMERCRSIGIEVPIVAGVMPIYSVKMMENLAALCGATITKEVRDGLAQLPQDDKSAVADFGVNFALKQCRELIQYGVQGIHFYTMDRSKTVVQVVNHLRSEDLL